MVLKRKGIDRFTNRKGARGTERETDRQTDRQIIKSARYF